MQRRLIVRPAQPHGGADEQREQADGSEHEIHRAAARQRRQRDVECLLRPEANDGVREPGAGGAAVLQCEDVRGAFDGRPVDGNQHVAAADSGRGRRRIRSHLRRRHTLGTRLPEHPVLDLVRLGTHRDVGQTEHEQDRHHGQSEQGPSPRQHATMRGQRVRHGTGGQLSDTGSP